MTIHHSTARIETQQTEHPVLPRIPARVSQGDAFIQVFHSVLMSTRAPVEALRHALDVFPHSSVDREVERILLSVEGGASLSQAFAGYDCTSRRISKSAPAFWGEILPAFLARAEDRINFIERQGGGIGLQHVLGRYLEVQQQREINRCSPRPKCTSPLTRDFALVAGTLLDMGELPPAVFTVAASDKPQRFRAAVARAVGIIEEGNDSLASSFEPERGWHPFAFKFDPLFIRALSSGEASGGVARMLIEFGSQPWSLGRG